jgi:hypothetical protein
MQNLCKMSFHILPLVLEWELFALSVDVLWKFRYEDRN